MTETFFIFYHINFDPVYIKANNIEHAIKLLSKTREFRNYVIFKIKDDYICYDSDWTINEDGKSVIIDAPRNYNNGFKFEDVSDNDFLRLAYLYLKDYHIYGHKLEELEECYSESSFNN